jgi:hypothetical protein
MTLAEWQTLSRLCRTALDGIPTLKVGGVPAAPKAAADIADALALSGAFAAAVADGMARMQEHRS